MTKLVLVAAIIGAHGIRGEVKIKSFTATPSAFATYGPLNSKDGRVFEIAKSKFAKDEFICTLKNIVDRNQAEALRGVELFVVREKLPQLPQGEFYLSDLLNKQVMAEGKLLGIVAGFQNYGAGELMELQSGELIPVRFVVAVDEKILINLPEGFLEDELPQQ